MKNQSYLTEQSFSEENWSSSKFQMKNLIRSADQMAEWVNLSDDEKEGLETTKDSYLFMCTPYYASLMDKEDPNCPIRLQAIPSAKEMTHVSSSDVDPVGDTQNIKTRRVVHKYPNRIILLVSDTCPVYCRHCTRKFHTTSTDKDDSYFDKNYDASYEPDFEYIKNHPEIDDVLLTGGDPLTLTDSKLEWIIKKLREIPHINIIRLGSRYPVFLPQRVTNEFCSMLEKYHPIWLNTHFNHPVEITDEAAAACDRLMKHGIPVQNQSVLLKGVNDTPEIMRQLTKKLLNIRVRPYYMYHCDNVSGVSHFMTSLETGKEIMNSMQGFETGFSVPNYVVTTTLGKIPVSKDHITESNNSIVVENYKGQKLDITDYVSLETTDQ